jgi:hypothetical protein
MQSSEAYVKHWSYRQPVLGAERHPSYSGTGSALPRNSVTLTVAFLPLRRFDLYSLPEGTFISDVVI